MKKFRLENARNLTNAMFINGLSLNIDDTSNCQEIQIDFSKDFSTCSDNDVGCNKIDPDPRHYNLSADFIFVEQEWGSLFYKHIGKTFSSEAKMICSDAGPNVHLPIPRFYEEQEFYRTYFAEEGLWLDVTYDASEGVKSANHHWFLRFVKTYMTINDENGFFQELSQTDEKIATIKYHEWINLAGPHEGYFSTWGDQDVYMNNLGQWDWKDEDDDMLLDAVCIFDIPDERCSKCQNESFCRYKDISRKETECICKKTTKGDNCEVDLCSRCQNGGFCDLKDATYDPQCICPFPYYGQFCEGET